ncbi:hypothetical protein REIS_1477 [Rickettsia endosymbiont of Ixodes scapularis]|nr:hypothetical protein REIS_1477 [Rickettsia endosymbiont of Ixodes scapularis]
MFFHDEPLRVVSFVHISALVTELLFDVRLVPGSVLLVSGVVLAGAPVLAHFYQQNFLKNQIR